LRLNHSLRLCGENDTNADCCPKPLCVLETLQVSACKDATAQTSLLIQARIHANKTAIPNQVYQPLGSCPCDLMFRVCDVRCCCDQDCSSEDLKLFLSDCLPGPFGGHVSPAPDYQCSVQSSENSPDWFPFLCVNSPPENNPYLGLFYQGYTASNPGPSFQRPVLSAPVPVNGYIQGSPIFTPSDQYFTVPQENVTLVLDYRFYWKGNGITGVTLTRTVGTFAFNDSMLTTRYSAVFLNGYQVGRPVIAGIEDISDNSTGLIQRSSINLWRPVSDGLCSTAEKKPILFGENSTSGCLLPVSRQNLTECNVLETVAALQDALTAATFVAKSGNPDFSTLTDWLNISSSAPVEDNTSTCHGIPSYQHVHVWSLVTSTVEGIPQREIRAVEVYGLSTWALDCGGGVVSSCVDPEEIQLFPITSSVTFTDIPINTGPPTTFQINFTEYDCDRNDVCWPELAFPITRYYTEPYSQSLAKGFWFSSSSLPQFLELRGDKSDRCG
uniref:Tectonic family member 2 n=1 Tax=Stegastes partitus TaxID=144197 RepID=A0A3B5AJM0_9TELE